MLNALKVKTLLRIADLEEGAPFCSSFRVHIGDNNQIILSDYTGALTCRLVRGKDYYPNKTIENHCVMVSGVMMARDDQRYIDALHLDDTIWMGSPFSLGIPGLPASRYCSDFDKLTREIHDDGLQRLITLLFIDEKYCRSFLTAPASLKHHHAYPGGLAEHTLEVASLCWKRSTHLCQLDRELLLTAAMLHDIGKIVEYEDDHLSDRGVLVGHFISGIDLLAPLLDKVWVFCHPTRLSLTHILTARKAPDNIGLRRPRNALPKILHRADWISSQHHNRTPANDDCDSAIREVMS